MDNTTEKFTVDLEVINRYGVLNRITGLYAKRGYNIDNIYTGETSNPDIARMVITSKGDEYIRTQMVRQLEKLYDVLKVTLMVETNR